MKKVLFVATVVKTHIMVFHLPYLEWFKKNSYEVHVGAKNDYKNKVECKIPFCDKYIDVPFNRSPFHPDNIRAYTQLKNIIDSNEYDIIHCHTPVGGVLARLAARKARKKGTKVIYTAHGFHFYKGASLVNWLIYYPVERFLARYTDVLITINKEDYSRAKKSFKASKVEYVPGVGIDIERFQKIKVDKAIMRRELGIPEYGKVLLSVGELNDNKNHEIVIRALKILNDKKIHYIVCGKGELEEHLKTISKELGVSRQVHLLGFREDIPEIYKVSDIFVFPSKREGLPLSLMEAMASGLPVIASNIRGNTDLIEDKKGGYLVEADDIEGYAEKIEKLANNKNIRNSMSDNNLKRVEMYDGKSVENNMAEIYSSVKI